MAALSEEAVLAAQRGEPAALNEVYRALSPAVLGYFVSRRVEDPEGLTSEVFLAVLPRLTSVTGGVSGLRSLVFSVAHARHVDDVRRRSRQVPTVGYEPELDTRSSPAAEDAALANDAQARAIELLASLPPDQAEVLRLRILGDLSLEQVSEIMGRSQGAIKQLQRRGLLALRGVLSAGGVTR
ncbi:RNA polymerase sigma factor [Jatrophihabitans telluris]|uniref:RNA polymerase sigma factor n=1 Tax=Jatrophihabitans telluris TaxID=2038343 RepID=A0ABY4QWC9_9ACTN|nr:RNA polymerase sigma factor [Jatrophihabitans telluris]UQX87387.1 RNA polymerase sigma factor [Jatrophihabitans telluris]